MASDVVQKIVRDALPSIIESMGKTATDPNASAGRSAPTPTAERRAEILRRTGE